MGNLRSKIDLVRELGGGGLWFVVGPHPPTARDAATLDLPLVSYQIFRSGGGLLFVPDAEMAQRVNRVRDGLRGLTAVIWVLDVGMVAHHMPDAFAHRAGIVRVSEVPLEHPETP